MAKLWKMHLYNFANRLRRHCGRCQILIKTIPSPRCITTRCVVQVIWSLLSWTRLITLVSMTRHSDLPTQKNRHPNRIETPYELSRKSRHSFRYTTLRNAIDSVYAYDCLFKLRTLMIQCNSDGGTIISWMGPIDLGQS